MRMLSYIPVQVGMWGHYLELTHYQKFTTLYHKAIYKSRESFCLNIG
jgi:hypothetical protein